MLDGVLCKLFNQKTVTIGDLALPVFIVTGVGWIIIYITVCGDYAIGDVAVLWDYRFLASPLIGALIFGVIFIIHSIMAIEIAQCPAKKE